MSDAERITVGLALLFLAIGGASLSHMLWKVYERVVKLEEGRKP